jgi:hypothetical protein
MKFDLNFQELMEIEQGAPDFTWMTDHSWKKVWNSNLSDFLDLLQEVDSNSFEFGFSLFRVWLNHLINA